MKISKLFLPFTKGFSNGYGAEMAGIPLLLAIPRDSMIPVPTQYSRPLKFPVPSRDPEISIERVVTVEIEFLFKFKI